MDSEWSLNPLNFFDDDYEFAPVEYSARITVGFAKAAYHTAKDTVTRTADLTTQGTAFLVKKATFGHVQLPYTKLSPEAKRYDENLSYVENLQKTGSETKEGIKALAKGVVKADPEAIGTAGFIVATSVGGKPPNFPNIPFSVPQLATSVTTAGVRATELVWESTSLSTSALAKFGAPILAVAATSASSGGSSSGGAGSAGDQVLAETLAGKGNFNSKFTLTADEALATGQKFLGPGYKEIGKPGSGVFRSADGLRQFRMDANSMSGAHPPNVPHVHLETYDAGAKYPTINNHVPFIP